MVKHLEDQKVITSDLEKYVDVDSDCEGGSAGGDYGTLKEEENEEVRAVLIAGSFSSYVHFLAPPSP